MKKLSLKGASAVFLVNDILPIQFPELFPAKNFASFMKYSDLLLSSNGIICTTEAGACEFSDVLSGASLSKEDRPKIRWSHLGCDPQITSAVPSRKISAFISCERQYFLMVGAREPRKRHAIALEAFEKIWAERADADLIVVGNHGWDMEFFSSLIRTHPECRRKLHWIVSVTDSDLQHLYKGARALFFASVAERVGLPILEVAAYATPLVASDIPALYGSQGSFFEVANCESLS